jgi:hypothetical protein
VLVDVREAARQHDGRDHQAVGDRNRGHERVESRIDAAHGLIGEELQHAAEACASRHQHEDGRDDEHKR